ncbi:MAG: sugar ABC transporter ATP-binding protein, partial [Clostridiales bacterium]|nr:sugar ABC transporter ATP-binding protein [Clostridiales bacterium]
NRQTVEENINILFLNEQYTAKPFSWVKSKKLRSLVNTIVEKHNIKFSSLSQLILELSGGNMQKTIIGRSIEIENNDVMVLDEPTNGIDIGAKYEIYRKIRFLAEEQDRAVLFISSEVNELLAICDRIYVFHGGDIVGMLERDAFSKIDILNMALGKGA